MLRLQGDLRPDRRFRPSERPPRRGRVSVETKVSPDGSGRPRGRATLTRSASTSTSGANDANAGSAATTSTTTRWFSTVALARVPSLRNNPPCCGSVSAASFVGSQRNGRPFRRPRRLAMVPGLVRTRRVEFDATRTPPQGSTCARVGDRSRSGGELSPTRPRLRGMSTRHRRRDSSPRNIRAARLVSAAYPRGTRGVAAPPRETLVPAAGPHARREQHRLRVVADGPHRDVDALDDVAARAEPPRRVLAELRRAALDGSLRALVQGALGRLRGESRHGADCLESEPSRTIRLAAAAVPRPVRGRSAS